MPTYAIIYLLIAAIVLFGWLLGEVLILAGTCRRLERSAPPKLPYGAPSMDERTTALEAWRLSLAERAAKEQAECPSREHRISVHRAHLLADRAIVTTLQDGNLTDPTVLLNLAQARANEASNTEALRFLGSEA